MVLSPLGLISNDYIHTIKPIQNLVGHHIQWCISHEQRTKAASVAGQIQAGNRQFACGPVHGGILQIMQQTALVHQCKAQTHHGQVPGALMRPPIYKVKKTHRKRGKRVADNETAVDMARVSDCKYCGQKLVWLKSMRTDRMYPVEWDGETFSNSGMVVVEKNNFHNCPQRKKA